MLPVNQARGINKLLILVCKTLGKFYFPLASCLYNKSESGAGTGTGNGYGYGLTGTGTGTGIFEIVECVWYKNDG